MAEPLREVDRRLIGIFRRLTNDPGLELNRQMRRNDIARWDSMVHIQLVVSVEKEFGIKFTAADIARFSTIGQLCDLIDAKTGNMDPPPGNA